MLGRGAGAVFCRAKTTYPCAFAEQPALPLSSEQHSAPTTRGPPTASNPTQAARQMRMPTAQGPAARRARAARTRRTASTPLNRHRTREAHRTRPPRLCVLAVCEHHVRAPDNEAHTLFVSQPTSLRPSSRARIAHSSCSSSLALAHTSLPRGPKTTLLSAPVLSSLLPCALLQRM